MSYKKKYGILNLNKEEMRAEVLPIDFTVARRVKGPIYDVLVKELYEEGCTVAAKYFHCLSQKEDDLYIHGTIRHCVRNNSKLLYQIFDLCMTAEKAFCSQDCNGLKTSFDNMYQLLMLLEEHGLRFQWLVSDIFKIVMKIIRNIDPNERQPQEIIARLYYMYGVRLSQSQDDLVDSMKYLRRALELSRGQKWSSKYEHNRIQDPNKSVKIIDTAVKTLHEVAVRSLALVTVKYARLVGKRFTEAATEMAKEAMLLVAEVGITSNKFEFYNGFITYAEYLAESSNHNDAIKLLNKFNMYFNPEDVKQYSRLYCQQHIIIGVCHSNLNDIKQAKKDYEKAIQIARHGSYKDLEASALVHLAMLYGLKKVEYTKSKLHYENARKIYLELGDRENESKTHYLLAKLRANEMFPFFCDVLKYCGSKSPCNLYKLRRWKYNCDPFWIGWSDYLSKESRDPLCCLLTTEESVATLRSFQSKELVKSFSQTRSDTYKQSAIAMHHEKSKRKINPLKASASTAIISKF